jgi:hypothetical protein
MRALTLLAWLLAGPAFASRPIQPPAPEFPAQDYWINAKDLNLTRLRGRRVVLVAFLNTANINSLRALEALKAFDKRYALQGLMVIGIHTPEYGFQKDPAFITDAFRHLGVDFPVVLDNDRVLWKAYGNDGWPAFYLIDKKGTIIFDRLGEGGYQELEALIQSEIEKLKGAPPPGGPPTVEDPPPPGGDCGDMTPEVSLDRAKKIIDMDLGELPETLLLTSSREGELSTRGHWLREAEDIQLDQQNADLTAFARLIYRGAQGFAVVGPGEAGPVKFWVRQDDLWLDAGNAGRDVRFDADGRSYVKADRIGFKELVHNRSDNIHELILLPMRVGGRVYGFSFTNSCQKLNLR